MVFQTIRPLSRGGHFVSGELCLCTAGFVERLRLAVHKQSFLNPQRQNHENQWPPRDKVIFSGVELSSAYSYSYVNAYFYAIKVA